MGLRSLCRCLLKPKGAQALGEPSWWEGRTVPNLDMEKTQCQVQKDGLLKGYALTAEAVKKSPADTAFVAMDAKLVPELGALYDVYEVSLALLPRLEERPWTEDVAYSLEGFAKERRLRTMSLNIAEIIWEGVAKTRTTLLGDPTRLRKEVPGQNVVLVGFSLRGLPLPNSIDSAQKLALATQEYHPTGVAAELFDPMSPDTGPSSPDIHTTGRGRRWVCFRDKKDLERFTGDFDGKLIDGIIVKVERMPKPWKAFKKSVKTQGACLQEKLQTAATLAKDGLSLLGEIISPPLGDAEFPWCPNPEDAPPHYYDSEDD
ncbi:hypothetical protein F5Y11DRAFT_85102 [Daldinia sp. FL1419]|nr:hypothetical protein F5Y11DRAFT_85102 [Daldinia sp. FL1419]